MDTCPRMPRARTGPTDRCSTATGAGGRSSSDRSEATTDCVTASCDSIRCRCATITWLRAATSGACSTSLISSSGMPRSRNLRITCAAGS